MSSTYVLKDFAKKPTLDAPDIGLEGLRYVEDLHGVHDLHQSLVVTLFYFKISKFRELFSLFRFVGFVRFLEMFHTFPTSPTSEKRGN